MSVNSRYDEIQKLALEQDLEREISSAIAYDGSMNDNTRYLLKRLNDVVKTTSKEKRDLTAQLRNLGNKVLEGIARYKSASFFIEDLTGLKLEAFQAVLAEQADDKRLAGRVSRQAQVDPKWVKEMYDRISNEFFTAAAAPSRSGVLVFNEALEYNFWAFGKGMVGREPEIMGEDTQWSVSNGFGPTFSTQVTILNIDTGCYQINPKSFPYVPSGVQVESLDMEKTCAVLALSCGGVTVRFVLSSLGTFNRMMEINR